MQNLYVVPKTNKNFNLAPSRIEEIISYLSGLGIIGPELEKGEFGPGLGMQYLFHPDGNLHHCPGELTFEAFRIEIHDRAYFLPRTPAMGSFDGTKCPMCDDELQPDMLDLAFEKLSIFPVARVFHSCPSCCADVAFETLNFVQNIAISNVWMIFEGIVFSRLNPPVIEHLAKMIGAPLTLVNELRERDEDEWQAGHRKIY